VWFSGTDSCCHPSSIRELAGSALSMHALALADADDPAPYFAAPRGLLVEAFSESPPRRVDLAPWLHTWANKNSSVVKRSGVGAMTQVQRRQRNFGASLDKQSDLLFIGPATYTQPTTLVKTYSPVDQVEIGGYCSMADEVRIVHSGGAIYSAHGELLELNLRGAHRVDVPTTYPVGILVPDEDYDELPSGSTGEVLTIGDDVWIGYGARILGPVTVGTGAVVGSGSLVIKDVPAHAVVGGVSAKILRFRFDQHVRARMLRVQWWNWPDALVRSTHRWLVGDTAAFLDHFDPAGSLDSSDAAPADSAPKPS